MRSPGPRKIRWACKPAVHALLLLPFASLLTGFFTNSLGVNPVESITHTSGDWALRILLMTLAITPLARLTRSGWMIQFRRLVGLYCFFYVLLHFLTYLLFDLSFDFGDLLEDIIERPYITVGFAGFAILFALAATSTVAIRQRMGRAWTRLHQAVYAAGILGVVHFLWITRVDDTEPFIYGFVLVILLGYRAAKKLQKKRGRTPGRMFHSQKIRTP